jgi:hypothetical protein
MITNGWTFWQYPDGEGRLRELAAARKLMRVQAQAR